MFVPPYFLSIEQQEFKGDSRKQCTNEHECISVKVLGNKSRANSIISLQLMGHMAHNNSLINSWQKALGSMCAAGLRTSCKTSTSPVNMTSKPILYNHEVKLYVFLCNDRLPSVMPLSLEGINE